MKPVHSRHEHLLWPSHDGQVESVTGHDVVQCSSVVDHMVEKDVVALPVCKRHDAFLLKMAETVEEDRVRLRSMLRQGDVEVVVDGVACQYVGHRCAACLVHLVEIMD